MSDPELSPVFRRAFTLAYGLGALLCVVWPLVLQGLLGTILQPGIFGMQELAEELGYTFTGLVVLSVLFVRWRSGRVRAGFAALDESRQVRVMALEILLYSALFELSALFGLVYHGMGGPQAERYARSFIGLATVMFLVFVPRLAAWRQAAKK
jgi:hypothetical protein